MHTVIYDGSFDGWLCAVFDIYEYKLPDPHITTAARFQGNMFGRIHHTRMEAAHKERVWKGLCRYLSSESQDALYYSFLSELPDIENVMYRYAKYVFDAGEKGMENDLSNSDVITIVQTKKKVWREKHRMEAFVRFQKTADDLFFSIIEPQYNVLPLISKHFSERYADQRWLIYDAQRKFGIYYDKENVSEVVLNFSESVQEGKDLSAAYDDSEEIYQQLWQQYFKSVNIAARKNKKLHLQHMPARYWKYLTEKKPV